MLIFELILSLIIWSITFLPINSYIFGVDIDLPNKIVNRESLNTLHEISKISAEFGFSQSDLCDDLLIDSELFNPSTILYDNLLVKSTSTEAVAVSTDGYNLFIALNSASTSDYDLLSYKLNSLNLKEYSFVQNSTTSQNTFVNAINSGPGLNGLIWSGKNLFAVNSSINSAIQKFKFSDNNSELLIKSGDYKLPNSSSFNPIYANKISVAYPNLFLGLKKNLNEEFLSIDLHKLDNSSNDISLAINNKIELDSSVNFIMPFFEKFLRVFITSAKEPEIQDFCLNCTSTSSFDIYGSLGNVRSVVYKDNYLFVGRSSGNEELFKIKRSSMGDGGILNNKDQDIYEYEIVESVDVRDGVSSMLILGNFLIVATGGDNSKIQIRRINPISDLIKEIDSNIAIKDLECVRGDVYGVGNKIERITNDIIKNIKPMIFKII